MNTLPIGKLVKIDNGYAFKSSEYADSGARIIRISNVQKGQIVDNNPQYYPSSKLVGLDNYKIQENDLLMSLTGNVGRVGLFPKNLLPAYLNQRVCRIKINSNKIISQYIFHYFNSDDFERKAIKASNGIAQLNLSTKWIEKHKICVPPVPEQKHIATILDKADALRQKNKQLLDAYDELLQATFLDMFGDPVTNPRRWEKRKLGEFGEWKSGGTPSRSKKEYYEGNIPWLSSGELENMYVSDSIEYITEKAIIESAAKKIQVGSLLLGMYDTAALKSSINTKILTCNQAIAFAKLDEQKINTEFTFYQIQLGKEFFRSKQRGVRQKNLNLSMIKSIELIYPPIGIQNQFARIVKNVEAQKAILKQSIQESEDLFNGLVQKAFNGELQ